MPVVKVSGLCIITLKDELTVDFKADAVIAGDADEIVSSAIDRETMREADPLTERVNAHS